MRDRGSSSRRGTAGSEEGLVAEAKEEQSTSGACVQPAALDSAQGGGDDDDSEMLPEAEHVPLLAVQAEPVRVYGVVVATIKDYETARLSATVLRIALAQALLQVLFAGWDILWHEETWSVAVVSLLWSLVLPACGFLGVKNADRTMLSCFCGWSFLIAFSSAFWCVYLVLFIMSSERLIYLLKLALELFVMTLMCSAGYFGNELCNKPYWDTQMHGIDGQVPIDIVDMAAQPDDASEQGAVAPIEDMPRAMISTPENIV